MAKAMYNMIHTILGIGIAHTAPIYAGWTWLPKNKDYKKITSRNIVNDDVVMSETNLSLTI